jgi:hypothetical protein
MRTPLIERILNTAEINKILVEKLLDGYEKGQAEGESIHIADSTNLPMILRPQGQIIQDTRAGYNLLDAKNKYPDTHKKTGIDFTNNGDGTFSVHGTATEDTSINLGVDFIGTDIVPGEEYSLYSNIPYNVNTFNLSITYGGPDIENQFLIANKEKTIDTKATWATLNLYIPGGQTINIDNAKIMICKGAYDSSKAFELYGPSPSISFPSPIKNVEGNYKIENINSNLYDINDLSEKNGNIQIDKDDWISGTIDNSGGSGYVFLNFFSRKKDYIKANKKHYVLLEVKKVSGTGRLSISSDFQGSSQFTSFGYDFSNLKSNSKYLSEITTINDFSKTIFALRSYLQFQSGESGSITFRLSLLNNKPDLEKFIYKKHDSKILELNIPKQIKLYNKNDGFIYLTEEQATELELVDGEGWYVYNEWGEIVIVGTEHFIEIESIRTPKTYVYQFDYTKLMSLTNNNVIGAKCNYFNENTANNVWSTKTDLEAFSLNINHTLHIRTKIAPDLFKTWLEEKNTEGNPLKVVGKLVNPTYTKITDKNFIKQLENLVKAFAYEGVTNIDAYSTDDKEKAPLIISAEYLKSQKLINKNLETRITALENALINNI